VLRGESNDSASIQGGGGKSNVDQGTKYSGSGGGQENPDAPTRHGTAAVVSCGIVPVQHKTPA